MKKTLTILLVLLGTTSCALDQSFVENTRQHYDRHVPIYTKFLNGEDPQISEPEREALLRNLESWDLVIRKAEGR